MQFAVLRAHFPDLDRFHTMPALLDHQHGVGGDPAPRFHTIRVLVTAAQSDESFASLACTLTIIALWPGLDGVHARVCRDFPKARAEMAGDVLSGIAAAIGTLDLARVAAVAGTLVANVERDIRRGLLAAERQARRMRDIDDPQVAAALAYIPDDDIGSAPDSLALLGALSGTDAELLRRILCLGETQEEAGRALGASHEAARKRCQRAFRRLRANIT